MNLERVIPQNSNYMVLKKISEFSNKYLCIELEESSQKTNKGESSFFHYILLKLKCFFLFIE